MRSLPSCDAAECFTISSPWQNCGTGVSPVVFMVTSGVSESLFSLSPRAAKSTSEVPSANPAFQLEQTQRCHIRGTSQGIFEHREHRLTNLCRAL